MSSTPRTQSTNRFFDLWPYICMVTSLGVWIAMLVGLFWARTLIAQRVQVTPDESVALKPIQLKQEQIGALRIDVNAQIPSNRWVTYEIQLKDQQGNVIAGGLKNAWKESGTWYEEGESGTWSEEDLGAGLDVRSDRPEPVTVVLNVLEYMDTNGKEIDQPVVLDVKVRNGVIDDRYLWAGVLGTTCLTVLGFMSVSQSGRQVIRKSIKDSDVGDRATLGGSNKLIRVVVKIKSDETSPRSLNVELAIKDGNGEQLYFHSYPVKLQFSKNDGKVTGASGTLHAFFVLEPRSSYGFYVEVTPDNPVDRTTLIIRENARTLHPVDVTYLKST